MRDTDEAMRMKNQGNALFARGKFSAAADLYTQALVFKPDWTGVSTLVLSWCHTRLRSVLLLNRALCNRKLEKWPAVEADCLRVLALDSESIKGHYYVGLALQHHLPPQLSQASQHLHKAMELARQQGDTIKDDIWKELAKVKYAMWEHAHAERRVLHEALRMRLEELLRDNESDVTLLGEVFDAASAAVRDWVLIACLGKKERTHIHRTRLGTRHQALCAH